MSQLNTDIAALIPAEVWQGLGEERRRRVKVFKAQLISPQLLLVPPALPATSSLALVSSWREVPCKSFLRAAERRPGKGDSKKNKIK